MSAPAGASSSQLTQPGSQPGFFLVRQAWRLAPDLGRSPRWGNCSPRVEGTLQGGPLSPLLSNILLDELDKELARRDHALCR